MSAAEHRICLVLALALPLWSPAAEQRVDDYRVAPAAVAEAQPPAATADSQERVVTPSPIADRFAVRVGYVDGRVRTDAQVNDTAAGIAGTPFSAERDFAMPGAARQARVELMVRLKNRGRLRVGAFDLSRRGDAVLGQQIRYGDQTYRVNERVTSQFDLREFNLTWNYSLIRGDRFEFGPGLGFHFIQTEAVAQVPVRGARVTFDGAGPFLTLALDSSWRFTRRFSFNARYQAFDLTVSDVSAKLYDAHADVQFRWHPNVAMGLGYQSNAVRLNLPLENPGGSLRMDTSGPELFLRASF